MADELNGIIGKHLIYKYENGWKYEMYVKNATTMDYRIHSGMVAGRWVKEQQVHLARLSSSAAIFKVSWTEPTGTSVSVVINLDDNRTHGTIFFPRWVVNEPKKTACFQNEYLNEMHQYRDSGPTYPIEVVNKFAQIIFLEDCKQNDETVIACGPSQLPDGYAECSN